MISILVLVLLSFGIASHSQSTAPGLQVSPRSIDFGENAVESDSPPHDITVSNPTKSPIAIEQIIASGIDFSEKNNCGKALAPAAQCTIQVSFTPAISGPRLGNLEVMESSGIPQFVALTGIGK